MKWQHGCDIQDGDGSQLGLRLNVRFSIIVCRSSCSASLVSIVWKSVNRCLTYSLLPIFTMAAVAILNFDIHCRFTQFWVHVHNRDVCWKVSRNRTIFDWVVVNGKTKIGGGRLLGFSSFPFELVIFSDSPFHEVALCKIWWKSVR